MSIFFEVSQLSVTLKDSEQKLVSDVSFSLSPRESLIILGQSGSGKTMTCRSIMDLLDAKRFSVTGGICFEGRNLRQLKPKEKRKIYGGAIAMIPQNPMTAFDPSVRIGLQIKETLMLHDKCSPALRKEKVLDALTSAGLSDAQRVYNSYPHMLSGGMLQRAAIAMALMVDARLIIADEPTTALDVIHRIETVKAFCTLRSNGAAILLVTHDFSVAAQLGGGLMIMKDSTIVERGQVSDVLTNPTDNYTKELLAASKLKRAQLMEEVTRC